MTSSPRSNALACEAKESAGIVFMMLSSSDFWAGLPAFDSARRSAAVRTARSALASTAQPRAGLDGENGVLGSHSKATRLFSHRSEDRRDAGLAPPRPDALQQPSLRERLAARVTDNDVIEDANVQ